MSVVSKRAMRFGDGPAVTVRQKAEEAANNRTPRKVIPALPASARQRRQTTLMQIRRTR